MANIKLTMLNRTFSSPRLVREFLNCCAAYSNDLRSRTA